jgi:hypothetical protein
MLYLLDPYPIDFGTSWRRVISFKPRRFIPKKGAPGTRWIGGWVGCRSISDDMKNLNFLSECCCLKFALLFLWREDGSAICSVITQWSESRRTRNHTLLSHLRLPQPWPGSRSYIPQEQGGPVIPLGTGAVEPLILLLTIWTPGIESFVK